MPDADPDRFIDKFQRMWAAPRPDSFADLFAADGTLLHPTMREPISRADVPAYVRQLTTLVPDLSLAVRHWSSAGDVVLIEWVLTGTFDGEPVEITGADRFTLRGDQAVEGVAYFDTNPLWARIDPALDRGHLLDALQARSAA